MADDTLTARNRINQRNFRARRQNYIKDLEERLRKYESEGVQATIEIQTAARQVTEQNIKLRALLISRYGMHDHDIENYLNTHAPPPVSIHSSLLPVALTGNPLSKSISDLNGFNLLSSPHNGVINNQQAPSASILSPALGLASLHKASDQTNGNESPTKKQRRDLNTHMSISALTSTEENQMSQPLSANGQYSNGYYSPPLTQDRSMNDQDPDTLSESSNPHTPAESLDPLLRAATSAHNSQLLKDNTGSKSDLLIDADFQPNGSSTETMTSHPDMMTTPSSDFPTTQSNAHDKCPKKRTANGEETACEDAARIIASMRGTRPEQIMMEFGCAPPSSPDAVPESCKVKNLSIFSLMDRA